MKRIVAFLFLMVLLCGCGGRPAGGVAATTGTVACFAEAIAAGTDVPVTAVISDAVSCLHDYSLSVRQMQTLETSDLVLISGAGLEDFMADVLPADAVDCSRGTERIDGDPHYWLDPDNAARMAENICDAMSAQYPDCAQQFAENTAIVLSRLESMKQWGQETLLELNCREIITFHDGFSYLADAFELEILAAVEEESGSEASAADLTEIIDLVEAHSLPCVFTEVNGSTAAASVITAETGVSSYALDMAMGQDYFDAMEHNITTLKEALQ